MTYSLSGSANITWQLLVTTFIDAAEDGVTGTLLLSLPQTSRSQKLPIKLSQGLQKVSLPVMSFTEEDCVKPWWPQGYGKPNLYTVKVIIMLYQLTGFCNVSLKSLMSVLKFYLK